MKKNAEPLAVMTGAEARASELPEGYYIEYIPSLASNCLREQNRLNRLLLEKEFEFLRDKSGVLISPSSSGQTAESRGHADIETYDDYLATAKRWLE